MSGSDTLQEMLATARLTMAFGEVERATQHPDGRQETDTTHTVMLGLMVMRLHWQTVYGATLNLGRLLEFVLVHDLVEAYAGDTSTMRALGPAAQSDKDAREAVALERIRREAEWIASRIDIYERQDCPEARLVRLIDKMGPKLTHLLNGQAVPKAGGMTPEEQKDEHRRQRAKLRARYPEFTNMHRLLDEACEACEAAWTVTP